MFGIDVTASMVVHAALFVGCVHFLVSRFFEGVATAPSPRSRAAATHGSTWAWVPPIVFTASLGVVLAGFCRADLPVEAVYFSLFGLLGWMVVAIWAGQGGAGAFTRPPMNHEPQPVMAHRPIAASRRVPSLARPSAVGRPHRA
ncbi:MAG: hypothetical protein OZSIB_2039 [Candidatus Ozemobacter sibiricus]|jgi:hypothetical protein|uniref:Uncharacterized protein n=1 Tax=Candidatus Ozemobacter sibiricus TaxID=2268124 RepID=A0A367ZIN0_9BACT|nr:MAG: hypothetical protein OZSIB_2039 [Candidatus Ozemobacter sibiricus]